MLTGAIPTFALYGEDTWQSPAGFAHIETIAARSALHDWHIAPHRHDRSIQMLLVESGPAQVTLEGAMFDLAGPSFILVPTGAVHGFRFQPETAGYVLTLSQEFARRADGPDDPLAARLAQGGQGNLDPATAARAVRLADELSGLSATDQTGDALFAALAEAFMRCVTTNYSAAHTPGDRRLALFRHLVETHLAEHRPIEFYARSIGMTVRTLTRLTRRHLGQSPQVLINRRLALEAQRLLRYTDASSHAIATDLGFDDPSYFSRFYLRMTGRRPQDDR